MFLNKLVLISVALCCFSCASTERLSGYVRIYGSEPHTYVCITSGDKIYGVYPLAKANELRKLQGQHLEFTVRFVEPPPEGLLFAKDGCVTPLQWSH